jgi:hypothetical protein
VEVIVEVIVVAVDAVVLLLSIETTTHLLKNILKALLPTTSSAKVATTINHLIEAEAAAADEVAIEVEEAALEDLLSTIMLPVPPTLIESNLQRLFSLPICLTLSLMRNSKPSFPKPPVLLLLRTNTVKAKDSDLLNLPTLKNNKPLSLSLVA